MVQPLCLPATPRPLSGRTSLDETRAYVAGWGVTSFDEEFRSPSMMWAGVDVTRQSSCREKLAKERYGITATHICANDKLSNGEGRWSTGGMSAEEMPVA